MEEKKEVGKIKIWYSIDLEDAEGNIVDQGIFIHYEENSTCFYILKFQNIAELDFFISILRNMSDKIWFNYLEETNKGG